MDKKRKASGPLTKDLIEVRKYEKRINVSGESIS